MQQGVWNRPMIRGLRAEEHKSGGGVDETYSLKDFSGVLQKAAVVANRIEGRKLAPEVGQPRALPAVLVPSAIMQHFSYL